MMAGIMDFLPDMGGFNEGVQRASPLLLAMGQNLQRPRSQRDPMAMQRAMMQMQAQDKERQEEARKRQIMESLTQPGQGGQSLAAQMGIPEHILRTMDPQAAQSLLVNTMMERNDPMYGVLSAGGNVLRVGEDGVETLHSPPRAAASPWDGLKELGGKLYRMGANGPEVVLDPGNGQPGLTGGQAGRMALLAATGLDETTAAGIVGGRFTTSVDPLTREATVIDVATGKRVGGVSPETAAAAAEVVENTEDAPNPYENAESAFGTGSVIRGGVNIVSDTLGAGTVFPETQEAGDNFRVLRENLLNDMASAYQRQPPSWLLKEIRNNTPEPGSVFQGPGGAQSKLQAIDNYLANEEAVAKAQLAQSRSPGAREILEMRALSLGAARQRIAKAQAGFAGGGQTTEGGSSGGGGSRTRIRVDENGNIIE